MATKPTNTAPIEKGTGKSWKEWVEFLESIDARSMPHKDIVQAVFDTGDASGWWAQSITVAYGQHIGRRVSGQDSDGNYQVSVTKSCRARWTTP